ncbi:hypothetical protein [Anaerovibrio lipolyticus]|uniref:hypothetical protein n=1 Tax=Anaerovibrio lipolyticus TaxID=82374 RepID=UPI00068DF965|nr:hypothetical protein [Anaerovibrio lipolyticus]
METVYQNSNRLLIDEPPIVLQPSLAVLLGVNEALFIQQLHYWIQYSKNIRNGRKWVYNSYESWQEKLPVISVTTIKRIISSLKKKGILLSDCFNKNGFDRTSWYTLDYEKLDALLQERKNEIRNQHKEKKNREPYVDPSTEEEISEDKIPENLKAPFLENIYKNPSPPVSDSEDEADMNQWSGQKEPMARPLINYASGQNGLTPAQNEPMDKVQNVPPLVQKEPMDTAPLNQPIPLEYTLEDKHKNTTTEEGQPQSYPQAVSGDDVVVLLKTNFPKEYELSQQAKIEPLALLTVLKKFPRELVCQYLRWTVDEFKAGKLHNPSGWFLAALKNSYQLYAANASDKDQDNSMAEVIRRTEEDMMAAIQKEIAELPPIGEDSPFFRFKKEVI